MAGDWIKIEKATAAKPEILELAERLNLHTDHVLGLCVRFWSWCDDQLHDGNALRVTTSRLDALFGHPGFVPALIEVGWLRVCAGSLVVPNFDRHLSESAKSRGLTRKRVQKIRAKTERPAVTLAALPEKRREEKKEEHEKPPHKPPPAEGVIVGSAVQVISRVQPRREAFNPLTVPLPVSLDHAEFSAAWADWSAERKARGKPLTERAARTQLASLERHGATLATAAIRRSIASGWTGLFPEQEAANGRTGNSRPRLIQFGPGQVTPGDEDPFKRPPRPLCDRPGYSAQAPAATRPPT